MNERQEQMIFDEGRRRGRAERHKMLDDGTLVVSVDDAIAVTRVLVEDDKKNGNLYYADRPKGKWKPFDLTWGRSIYYCSECEESVDMPTAMGIPIYKYCPNCGAEMKGADDE